MTKDRKLTLAWVSLAVLLGFPWLFQGVRVYAARTFQPLPMAALTFVGYPLLGVGLMWMGWAVLRAPRSPLLPALEGAALALAFALRSPPEPMPSPFCTGACCCFCSLPALGRIWHKSHRLRRPVPPGGFCSFGEAVRIPGPK